MKLFDYSQYNVSKPLQNSLTFLEAIERADPSLFETVYPRVYQEPKRGSYYSPRLPASQMAQVAIQINQGLWGQNQQVEFLVCSQLARFRVPTYYIGLGLMDALAKTRVKGEVSWRDMHMPYESAVFLPPKGSVQHPTEGDLVFIGYARFKGGEKRRSRLCPTLEYGSINDGITLFAESAAGVFYHWSIDETLQGPSVVLTDVEDLLRKKKMPQHRSVWPLRDLDMTPEDNRLMIEVAHYVFALLMVMTARPVLLTSAEMRKRVQKQSITREFWTCPIIGESYGIRYQRAETSAPVSGSHASPLLHWVRGFTREQRYGKGRTMRKTVWIEPFMRGGNEDEREDEPKTA